MVEFKLIPDTELEIASHGRSHNRVLLIRVLGTVEPISVADNMRVVLIGNPEVKFRHAMRTGHISRPKLSAIIAPVSGNTYQKLRVYLGKFN